MELKAFIFEKQRASEVFTQGLRFLESGTREERENGRVVGTIFTAKVLEVSTNETLEVDIAEPVGKDIKAFDEVDFENAEITFKGIGKGVINGGSAWARLGITAKANKVVKIKGN